jgi:peptide/nickel transport system substrate-binding protein
LQIITEQRPPWAGQPVRGGSLNLFARPEDFDDFIPTHFRQDFGVMVSYMDPLVWADQVTLEPKPWLARSWTFGLDGLTLDIVLRENVTWHDGTPFTAEDVRFSLLCYRDDYESAVSFLLAVMQDVEVLDELTVRVVFDEPDGNFPFNAANLPMFQRQQWETHWLRNGVGERTLADMDFGDGQPLGTGPWIIDSRQVDQIEFRPNEQHFGAVPWTEQLTISAEPDFATQLASWRNDDASLIWPFPGRDFEANRDEPGFLVVAESTISFFAAFNFENPLRAEPGLLALPGIREAMNLAIDRQGFAETLFGGMIDVQRAGFMTQPWAVDPGVQNPGRNVAAARQILADNGWGDWDGDGVLDSPTGDRGAFTCIVREDADANFLAILEGLDADFREIGLTLEVQRLSPDDYTNRWINLFDYDLIAIELNQYPAFNEFDLVGSAWSIRRNSAGWNPGGYWNPVVDDAIFAYLSATDVDAMREQLQIIQEQTNDDLFALWLGFPSQPVLIRPDLSGFQPNKMWQSWNTWALWQDEDSSVVTPTPLPPTPTPTPTEVPPVATPQASPVASPAASPVATPEG